MSAHGLGSVAWSNAMLEVVEQVRLKDHLVDVLDDDDARLEASGVHVHGDHAYIVFDNRVFVARVPLPPSDGTADVEIIDIDVDDDRIDGFEDLTWDAANQRWLLLVESVEHADGDRTPLVVELTAEWDVGRTRHLDFVVASRNKGFEGLACVPRDGVVRLLGLCEGNHCRSGDAGREPGGGRLQVFDENGDGWRHSGTIPLPIGVAFTDYAGVSINDGRVAVVSQESSALWVAGFSTADLAVTDGGTVYRFPLDGDRISYCTVEGVSWWGGRLVTVSDRAKDDHGRACRGTQESMQIIALPDP
jgi:hypothetical protein